jgi:hypothetical protein
VSIAIICLLSLCCVLLLAVAWSGSRADRRADRLERSAAEWAGVALDLERRLNMQAKRHATELSAVKNRSRQLEVANTEASRLVAQAAAALAGNHTPLSDEEE